MSAGGRVVFGRIHVNRNSSCMKLRLGPSCIMLGLIWFGHCSFTAENVQRPDWICCSFCPTFELTRLEEIANIHAGGEFFFVHTNSPEERSGKFCWNSLVFDYISRAFACVVLHLNFQSGNNFRKPFHPCIVPLRLQESNKHSDRVWLDHSTMACSLWISMHPHQISVLWFFIFFETVAFLVMAGNINDIQHVLKNVLENIAPMRRLSCRRKRSAWCTPLGVGMSRFCPGMWHGTAR